MLTSFSSSVTTLDPGLSVGLISKHELMHLQRVSQGDGEPLTLVSTIYPEPGTYIMTAGLSTDLVCQISPKDNGDRFMLLKVLWPIHLLTMHLDQTNQVTAG